MSHPESLPNPDQKCALCQITRINHGDSNHVFSLDGTLVSVAPRPEPKKEAPKKRAGDEDADSMTQELAKSMELNAVLRLTEVLIGKGLLDAKDTLYIFSGFKG